MPAAFRPSPDKTSSPRRAVVLIAVLAVVAVLSYFAYQYADLATAEHKAMNQTARSIQTRKFAESGVHYIAALLSSSEGIPNLLGENLFDNPNIFRDKVVRLGQAASDQGKFSIVALGEDGQSYRFGMMGENAKLDLNALVAMDKTGQIAHDILIKLPNMTEEFVDAIIDWIDSNEQQRPAGCENEYYLGLSPPYRCKNAPLDSLEEMLLVRGVTPQLLYGNDKNRNGMLDADEADDGAGVLGWSAFLTVYSREKNLASDGLARINLNETDLAAIFEKLIADVDEEMAIYIALLRTYGPYKAPTKSTALSITYDLASAQLDSGSTLIMSDSLYFIQATDSATAAPKTSPLSKNKVDTKKQAKNSIKSLFDLVNSYVEIKPASGKGKSTYYGSPLNDPAKLKELMPILFDKTTTSKQTEFVGRVDVNTAPEAVLKSLPELTEEEVQKILSTRPDPGAAPPEEFDTPAWLISEAGLKPETLSKLDKYITTKSQVYRVQVLGYYDGGGPTSRIEAVIDANGGRPRILHWRDLTELGKGFEMSGAQ
jgi:type II secretory pathway component PulK